VTAQSRGGLRAGDGIVLRTPLLPITDLLAWAAASDPRQHLASLFERPEILEAVFVASPNLAEALVTWRTAPSSDAGRRAERSLVKYAARMMGRATPFGLFSGISVGKLGAKTELGLAPLAEYRRSTRLDNDYLFVLADHLAASAELRDRLHIRPNSSIYRTAGLLRYAAARVADKERSYQLVGVELTPYLEATLARAEVGATVAELAGPLAADDITLDEALEYVRELVDAQLLVPELGIHVTGPEPIDGLIAQLRAAGGDRPAALLADVRERINAIDAIVGNSPDRYRAIANVLEPLGTPVDLSRLFQIDMVKPAAATLATRVTTDVATAVTQLGRIRRSRGSLGEWVRTFRERYEDRVVPLAEVLDEESGIGFETMRGPGSEGAPLLAGLPFGGAPPDNRTEWGPFERHMLRRLAGAVASGADDIALVDADLAAMELPGQLALPDAFSTTIRIAGPAEQPTILLEGTVGPSGARILGRFCHASPDVEAIVRAHHTIEESLRPDAIYAEVVHLNQGRIGNILCRPVLRGHEIVYLGVSGAPREQQITLDDLLVTVRGERIVLVSRRLGREVIPRLTTAHNFRLRSLVVYRFLCALAGQDSDQVAWWWGALGDAPYLPRVTLGRVIVSRATWNLDVPDLEPITTAVRAANKGDRAQIAKAVAALRQKHRLPRMLALAAGDNELPIDLDNPLLVDAFADELAGAGRVQLVELFPSPDAAIVHGPEGRYANEIVLTFTRQRPPEPAFVAPAPPTIRREFGPSSEWLFAKIYCGEAMADRVLREGVAPVVRGHAGRWFFVRFQDPEPHLRVRFYGDPELLRGRVLPELERALAPLAEVGAVRKLVLDTYTRELERYGGDRGIELVEDVFWHDSEAVLAIVEQLDGEGGPAARWKLALRGIETMLAALGIDPETRARIFSDAKDNLGREISAATPLWTRIGQRFASERAELDLLFVPDRERDAEHDLAPGFELLAKRNAALVELGHDLRLVPGMRDFAWSLVHMHANRLLHASQRSQELVLYDFLRRLHASRKARKSL
jgi:thiopeptide-type bacteriocin biosynthesis protein